MDTELEKLVSISKKMAEELNIIQDYLLQIENLEDKHISFKDYITERQKIEEILKKTRRVLKSLSMRRHRNF